MSKAITEKINSVKGVLFTTPIGTLSFPKLFKPEQYQNKGDAHYSLTMLFPKSDPEALKPMQKAIIEAAVEAFGPDKKAWPKGPNNEPVSLPWRDGDRKSDIEGYAGNMTVSGKTKQKPVVVKYVSKTKQREPVTDESEIYGGNIGRAVFRAKATESGGKYYVTLYLQGFQKIEDGTRMGGGASVDLEDNFPDIDLGDSDPSNYEESFMDSDDGYEIPF